MTPTPLSQADPPPPPGFDSMVVAAALRDAITAMAKTAIDSVVPRAQRGRVIDIDFVAYKAQVWFPGDASPTLVNLFTSTLPGAWATKFGPLSGNETSIMGKGSQVLVENFAGSLYVTEVLTGGQFSNDWQMAGGQSVAYGANGLPEYSRESNYVYRPRWPVDGSVPIAGGPFAINIGPFVRDKNVDALNGVNDALDTFNGSFDIDIVSLGGNKRFSLTFDPMKVEGIKENFVPGATPNGFGGSIDTWYRMMPSQISADANRVVQQNLNPTWRFVSIDSTTGTTTPTLGDWTNAADTNTNVTLYTGGVPGAAGGYMQIQSASSHASLKVRESGAVVLPMNGARIQAAAIIYPTVTTADIRVGYDWYDVTNTFISTTTGPATNCPASVLTTVLDNSGTYVTPPTTARYARVFIQVNGTPATSTVFYVQNVQVSDVDSSSLTSWDLDVGFRQTAHGARSGVVTDSPGEIWLRLYIYWLGAGYSDQYGNIKSDIAWTVRMRNTNSFVKAQSVRTGLPVYEYDSAPLDAMGLIGVTDSKGVIGNNPTFGVSFANEMPNSGTWRNPDLLMGQRGQMTLTGGTVTATSTRFKWSGLFEFGGFGRSRLGLPNGYGTLAMPSNGTTIPVVPYPAASVTVNSSGIPLSSGQSLWYVPPVGSPTVALPTGAYSGATMETQGGFVIVDGPGNPGYWVVPEWWVFVGYRPMGNQTIKCGDGNFYGGSINIADVNTTVHIPGAADFGNEVYGVVQITPGAGGGTAPIGGATVSYSQLAGSSNVFNAQTTGNSGVPSTVFLGSSATLATATSTNIWAARTSGTQQVWYRIIQAP